MMKVEGLLKAGASVDCPDEPAHSTNSPLNWEREGHQAVLEWEVLEADVNIVVNFECTPLHWAADQNSQAAAELLLLHKADVNSVNGRGDGYTPLSWAMLYNSTEVAEVRQAGGCESKALAAVPVAPWSRRHKSLVLQWTRPKRSWTRWAD